MRPHARYEDAEGDDERFVERLVFFDVSRVINRDGTEPGSKSKDLFEGNRSSRGPNFLMSIPQKKVHDQSTEKKVTLKK